MTGDERQHILDDGKTWNLDQKKTEDNVKQENPTKGEMNWQVKHIQENIDANRKRIVSLPDDNYTNNNSVDPSNLIKERKAEKKVLK